MTAALPFFNASSVQKMFRSPGSHTLSARGFRRSFEIAGI